MHHDPPACPLFPRHPQPLDHLKEGQDTVDMEHNQVQLAEYFGVTRPALSKEINKLVDSGFIRISRNKVKVLNKQALISML